MSHIKTIHVSHLGGIQVGYQMPQAYDPRKPTFILINSFTTTSDLYRAQFADAQLTAAANLLAIEPLGHGRTKTKAETWTYWDVAHMNIQVMDALGIKRAFALGTSQGGFITVRMALIAPDRILGLMPLGTAMDSESPRMRALGSWDGAKIGTDMITAFTRQAVHGSNFTPSDAYSKSVVLNGYGENASPEEIAFWTKEMKRIYRGDEGRKSLIICAVNLREHDSLIGRLGFVKCPVLWMHGSKDIVFSVANAKDEIRMFTGSESAELVVVEGGHHFLSATHPEEVNRAMIGFVNKYRRDAVAKL